MKIARWYTIHEGLPEKAGWYTTYVMHPMSDSGSNVTVKYYTGNTWQNGDTWKDMDGVVLFWSDFNVYNWESELGVGWYIKQLQGKTSKINEAERLALEEVNRAIENYKLIKALTQ